MAQRKPKKEYRSRKAIKKAFLELLSVQSYQSITVQNILDQSEYSKGTFYARFTDKEDLVKQIVQDEVDKYTECTTQYLELVKEERPLEELRPVVYKGIENYFQHVYENQLLYRLIDKRDIPCITLNQLAVMFYEKQCEIFHISSERAENTVDLDFHAFLVTNAHVQGIKYWIRHDFQQSSKYIAGQLCQSMYIDEPLTIKAK